MREYLRSIYRTLLPLIYARSQYKLFLKESVQTMNGRVQQLTAAMDYFAGSVRPIPIQAPFGDSILIVAPHQDDEAIGCGGALALQVRSGRKAHIVMVQDGADGHQALGLTRKQLTDLRNEESVRAARVIGMESPEFLSYANLTTDADKIAADLRRIIEERRIDTIFTPYMLDGHGDHRTTNFILASALEKVNRPLRMLAYEVWGFCIPNVIVVIDEVMDQKIKMLECFDFANKAIDYVQSTKGLNMYRSRMLGAGMSRFAECYFEIPKEDYIELVRHIQRAG